ncbi:hypothetical protein AB6919_002236 [Vibrio cholerae]|uniref:Glycosyltransferase family 2 protein n=1 Tax=Vibrio cholerae TaxID=666 RepID=A0ABD7SPJ4_VIBCL|nr:hypothetical protein [Vibrio cholerae]EGQ7790907.1 hypothetical protein [Vibrio cholerae]EGQ8476254.1 hypothetical protein [Vibrio cholerae]EGR1129907.1 hypothetical protein [Vibrio cholerae]EGR4143745.1 hypothetical protein [Vibrio cholerae]EHD2282103.1 hypothetical protein [Vibrio cholerae]
MNSYYRHSDTVVLTTAFNVPLSVARDYFYSLSIQSENKFDIFIVNDGFTQMSKIRHEFPQLHIIEVEGVGIISKNREIMINHTRELYENCIFCDFDDFFSNNRIASSLEMLQKYDIVVNDVDLYKDGLIFENSLFSNNLSNNQELTLEDILQCNYFGMSNTAAKMSAIPSVNFDYRLKAVDWHLFSILLLNGASAVFCNEMRTIYRQYESNIANVKSTNLAQLKNEISVKEIHYGLLSKTYDCYAKLYAELNELSKQINALEPNTSLEQINLYDSSAKAWWSLINFNIVR